MKEAAKPTNRLAKLEEMERAHHALLSFPGISSAIGALLKLNIAMVKQGVPIEDIEAHPLVVRDFSGAIKNQANVLLVPPGIYEVPAEFLKKTQCHIIIGLPWGRTDYPTLMLEGLPWNESMAYVENEPASPPRVCDISELKFANVRLDAHKPTMLEMCDPSFGGLLTSRFQHVEYGQNIDVLDYASDTLCIGRDWARAAYGPKYGVRSIGIKALEGTYMGLLSGVDAVFRPLVTWGERLDKRFGLK